MSRTGGIVFAAAFVALGALTLAWRGFIAGWLPLPTWLAGHAAFEILCGAPLLACGAAMLWRRTARPAALVLAGILLLLALIFRAPRLVAHPLVEGLWEDAGETLVWIAGAWTLFASGFASGPQTGGRGGRGRRWTVRAGQVLFALALLPIGLSHFSYLGMTAPLVPAWLPFHDPIAWLTGVAHIAAGLGVLFGVLPKLAATLEAVMTSLFTLLVWVPALAAAPASRSDWSELFVSAAIAGAAWVIAGSLGGRPWGFARRR